MALRTTTESYLQTGAPTTSGVAASTFLVPRTLFFASEWEFLPEGLQVFKARFHNEIRKYQIIAHAKWDSESLMFQVKCSREQVHTVSEIFDKLLREIIREESGESFEEDPYLTNSSMSGASEKEHKSDKIRRISLGPQRELSSSISEEDDENEEKSDRLSALTLSGSQTSSLSRTSLIGNILYHEDSRNAKVNVRTFGQMGQRFFGTTIMDNMEILGIDNFYEGLIVAQTLCCHPRVDVVPTPIEKDVNFRDWRSYTYPIYPSSKSGMHATLTLPTKHIEQESEFGEEATIPLRQSTGSPGSQAAITNINTQAICNYKLLDNKKPLAIKSNPFPGRLPQPEPLVHRLAGQDPLPDFINDVRQVFFQIMESVKSFHKGVSVRAELGRIILRGLPSKLGVWSEYLIDSHEVHGLLVRKAQTQFTRILTTNPAEIHHLIDMKSSGKDIWKTKPSSWGVVYQFICNDDYSEDSGAFTIEINAETRSAAVVTKQQLGAVNVHGIKRVWDFRLAAYSIQSQDISLATYSGFAAAIQDSLRVPSDLSNPLLQFEIPKDLFHFKILGVRVIRSTNYMSLDDEATLNIDEIRELDLDPTLAHHDQATCWTATASPVARSSIDWLDFWYEASISSTKADTMLNNNDWDADGLATVDVTNAMCVPACHMLKQMDAVGHHNINGIKLTKATGPQRQRRSPSKGEPVVYW